MKTTVEIDQIITAGPKVLGAETIKETVEASLQAVLCQRQLQDLANALGKVSFELTTNQLARSAQERRGLPSKTLLFPLPG